MDIVVRFWTSQSDGEGITVCLIDKKAIRSASFYAPAFVNAKAASKPCGSLTRYGDFFKGVLALK